MIKLLFSFFIVAVFAVFVYGWYGCLAILLLLVLLWYSTDFAKPSQAVRILMERIRKRTRNGRDDGDDSPEDLP